MLRFLALFSVFTLLLSCNKEKIEPERYFSATMLETKSVSGHGKMTFEPGEVIDLWYNKGSKKVSVTLTQSNITNSGHTVNFFADVPYNVDVLATYGARGSYSKGMISLDFEGAEYVCTALCKAGKSNITFTNRSSILSFTLTDPEVKQIIFMGADPDNEKFIFDVPISFSNGKPIKTNKDGTSKAVTIDCDGVGTYRAAVLPGIDLSGFQIILLDENGEAKSTYLHETNLLIEENEYLDFGNVPKPTVNFTLDISNVTSKSALLNLGVSDMSARYIVGLMPTEFVNMFSTDEELIEDDFTYYTYLYQEYGYESLEDYMYNAVAWYGPGRLTLPDLDASTSYTIYVYAIDKNLKVLSDGCTKLTFTTLESNLEYLGVAIWHDIFAAGWYPIQSSLLDIPVDVYEDPNEPGVFHFDTPYGFQTLASWYGKAPEVLESYEGVYWKRCDIIIDASDPKAVRFPWQSLGFCLNVSDGWVSAGAEYGSFSKTGIYADGTITFKATDCLTQLQNYDDGSIYYAGDETTPDFTITMPEASAPANKSAAPEGTTKKQQARRIKRTIAKHTTDDFPVFTVHKDRKLVK